jgi:hypothetical protein
MRINCPRGIHCWNSGQLRGSRTQRAAHLKGYKGTQGRQAPRQAFPSEKRRIV